AAEHDLRAGETDAGAGVRAALDEEASTLRAVPEALPHRAVDEAALRVARLEHRDRSAERRLRGAVLRAAQERERDAVRRVRREAVPGDRAFAEARRELLAQRGEEAAEVVDRALEFARLEPLYAALGRLRDGVELCRDPDVAGVELAAAADRAADRDHGERAEANAIRAEAEHLRHVVR